MRKAETRRARIEQALEQIAQEREGARINLTDPDARLMKGRGGYVAGYNAQAAVSPVDFGPAERGGMLITGIGLTNLPGDHRQLLDVMDRARRTTGQAAVTLADGGYHSGDNLTGCQERGQVIYMPEPHRPKAAGDPYHRDRFAYDAASDCYTCPMGETLAFRGIKRRAGRRDLRLYQPAAGVCSRCPGFGSCTTQRRQGRRLEIDPQDEVLRHHRALMATEEARELYRLRKQIVEPAFGIIKEEQALRRFLRRGFTRVFAEWALMAVGFNLRTLVRIWRTGLAT